MFKKTFLTLLFIGSLMCVCVPFGLASRNINRGVEAANLPIILVAAPQTITAPETMAFTASVWLESSESIDVVTYQVNMTVDDTLVSVIDAWIPETNSSWIFQGESAFVSPTVFGDKDDDGAYESVMLGSSILGGGVSTVNGSVLLAIIELGIRGTGSATLSISEMDWHGNPATFILDPDLEDIAVDRQDGQVNIEGIVPEEPSIITLEVNPPTVAVEGQNVTIMGQITPDKPTVNVTIEQKYWVEESWQQNVIAKVLTNQTSQYEYIHSFSESGNYMLRTSWPGDQTHLGNSSEWIGFFVKELTVEVEVRFAEKDKTHLGDESLPLPTKPAPMNVTVKNVTDLCSWKTKIYYDPDIVEINNIWLPADNVLNLTGHTYNTTSDLGEDNHGSYLFCEAKINNQTAEGFTGNGTLFQFNVTGLAITIPGSTLLEVQECALANSTGHPILYGWGTLTPDGIFSLAIFGAFSTMMTVINPATGDGEFIFWSDDTSKGDLFNATIRIVEAEDLYGCLFELAYNSTLMNMTRVIQPVDDTEYVFYNKNSAIDIILGEGLVSVNNTLTEGEPFEGDGLIVIIEFEILVVATEEAIRDSLTLGRTKVYNLVRWRAITGESADYILRYGTCGRFVFNVTWGDETFPVTVISNLVVSNFSFSQPQAQINFNVTGPNGSTGFCNVTVPTTLLGGTYTVRVDNTTVLEDYDAPTNQTHAFIYFEYNHSSHTIRITGTTVIPEFPSFLIQLLFMTGTLLVVIVYRRKQTR